MARFPNPPFYTDPLIKSGQGGEKVFHPQWQDWFIKVAQYITATGGYGGGILPATSGGTGFGTYAVGDLLYASTTSALNRLADVATGNALISGGAGVAPSWGKIALTTHVSGTLPVANGGTGFTALSSLFANPSASIGTAAINGIATTAMRSDAVPAFDVTANRTFTGTNQFATLTVATIFRLPTDAAALQTACALYAGTGAPNNANGANGDYYFRSDGGVATHIYFKAAGAWAGIV